MSMRLLSLVAMMVAISGCAAEQPAGAAILQPNYVDLAQTWDLDVTDAYAAGFANGGPGDNCLMIQADSAAQTASGRVRVAWSAVSPAAERLHITFTRADGSWEPRMEGNSPLEFDVGNMSFEEGGQASLYVGAVRDGQVVVAQPVSVELALHYLGDLRTYSFGCTIAG